jgi:hypothetical protein
MSGSGSDVSELLHPWSEGDADAGDRLMPLVYDELRRRAAAYLRQEHRAHTPQPTALVHETYYSLLPQSHLRIDPGCAAGRDRRGEQSGDEHSHHNRVSINLSNAGTPRPVRGARLAAIPKTTPMPTPATPIIAARLMNITRTSRRPTPTAMRIPI